MKVLKEGLRDYKKKNEDLEARIKELLNSKEQMEQEISDLKLKNDSLFEDNNGLHDQIMMLQ